MRARSVVAVVALLVVLAAVVLAAPVAWLAVDESAVPPASDAPALPDGVSSDYRGVSCGSGGCWHEWAVSGPAGLTRAELADDLGIADGGCAARSLLDRREVCTSLADVGGELRLVLQFDRPLD